MFSVSHVPVYHDYSLCGCDVLETFIQQGLTGTTRKNC